MVADIVRVIHPSVMSVHAGPSDDSEAHIRWTIGYAPESDDDGRFLLAYLHAGGADARVDVEIAATLVGGPPGDIPDSDAANVLHDVLTTAPHLVTLYDMARIAATTVLGTIDAETDVPLTAPTPEITRLIRTDEAPAQ